MPEITSPFLLRAMALRFGIRNRRENHFLQNRVTLTGAVQHEEVQHVMGMGNMHLHPSLTEAFGTVLVEAASCGLYVVTPKVGGIPEVLPRHMTGFAEPEEHYEWKVERN